MYLDVYDPNNRPEMFFKSTATQTVGPGNSIRSRGDSSYNVPEPELSRVLYPGEFMGYIIGLNYWRLYR